MRALLIFLLFTYCHISKGNDTTYFLKVNIHFMIHPEKGGNFTETSDGLENGNPEVNGYVYAKKLVSSNNYYLYANKPMNLVNKDSSNQVAPKVRYRYVLTGVYFHRDSVLCYYEHEKRFDLLKKYGVNKENEINVFMTQWPEGTPIKDRADGGIAGCIGCGDQPVVALVDAWSYYKKTKKIKWLGPVFSKILNHEIGHLLDLYHNWLPDRCDDTPIHKRAWCGHNPDSNVFVDNNVMSYNCGQDALTQCQLERVYHALTTFHRERVLETRSFESPLLALFQMEDSIGKRAPKTLDGSWRLDKNKIETHYRVAVCRVKPKNIFRAKEKLRQKFQSKWIKGSYDKIELGECYRRKWRKGRYIIHFEVKNAKGNTDLKTKKIVIH